MVEFIKQQAGLLQFAMAMPETFLEHAPQLAIRGFGGPVEKAIEAAYQDSIRKTKLGGLRMTHMEVP
jgi:hypothetical protein